MKLDDIDTPQTSATLAALEVTKEYFSSAMLNHSVRSYLYGAAYGKMNSISFDDELLYVTSMLHDIGVVKEFDSYIAPFEVAGGNVAWLFGAAAGWSADRRAHASDVIKRHMWNTLSMEQDPEGNLLQLSAGLDIAGRNLDSIPAELRTETTRRYPRLGLGAEFAALFRDQAARKPDSTAGAFIHAGVAEHIESNPLDD